MTAPGDAPDATQKPFLANVEDVPWETFSHGVFGSEDRDLTGYVRASKLDLSLTRIPPGRRSCPYHFHHAEEELFYVLEGSGLLRYGGQERRVRPGDVIGCPPGPDGAHQFINDTDAPLVYLAFSNNEPLEIAEYPDSDKVMARVAAPDGTRIFRRVFLRGAAVDYFTGEPAPGTPSVGTHSAGDTGDETRAAGPPG